VPSQLNCLKYNILIKFKYPAIQPHVAKNHISGGN